MERETVVVGEQERKKFAARRVTKAPENHVAPVRVQHRHHSPTPFRQPDYGSKPNVETTPVQTRPPRYVPTSLFCGQRSTLELQESPLSESRGASHSPTPSRHARSSVSSLVLRFVKDQFDDYRESTIGGEDHQSLRVGLLPTSIDPPQLHS